MIGKIEELRNACAKGEKFNYLLFWGHTQAKDGAINSACLSQWMPCSFMEGGIKYSSAEQYMMAGKAKLFDDQEVLQQIIKTHDPKSVKALGRKVKNFDDKVWKSKCFDIVVQGNLLKFSQNKDLSAFLISTGDEILVEASPYDRIWGIGMGKENQFAQVPEKWQGQNLLGFALMSVRERIKSEGE